MLDRARNTLKSMPARVLKANAEQSTEHLKEYAGHVLKANADLLPPKE